MVRAAAASAANRMSGECVPLMRRLRLTVSDVTTCGGHLGWPGRAGLPTARSRPDDPEALRWPLLRIRQRVRRPR